MFDQLPIKEIASMCSLFVVAMVRMGAALAIVPFFSKQFVVGTGRNVVIFAMCFPLIYLIWPALPKGELSILVTGLLLIKEAVIGIVLGFTASFIFYTSEGVGFVVDVQRGSSMATIFDPLAGSQTSLMGSFLIQMMTVAFFSGGGFLFFMALIYKTYKVWPVFSYFPQFEGGFAIFFNGALNQLMVLIFCLVAPILLVLFLTEFGLGLVNRFAPHLNVFFLAMPIKSWLSMVFLMMYLSLLGYFFELYFTSRSKLAEFVRTFVK
jgi:type III secretion protein T